MEFSFFYDGKKYFSEDLKKSSSEKITAKGTKIITDTFTLENLLITRTTEYFNEGGEYAVTHYKNTGNTTTPIISDICDADDLTDMCSPSPAPGWSGYGRKDFIHVYDYRGSGIGPDDFSEEYNIPDDRPVDFCAEFGRSSEKNLPFFDIDLDGKGIIYAIGWTGSWFAHFQKEGENQQMRAKIGVKNLNFYLNPQEEVRTAAVMKFPYSNGRQEGHNQLKRIIKNYLVIDRIKKETLPVTISFWGGAKSEMMLRRLDEMKEHNLDFECFWIDAGWYGDYKEYCPSEFHSAWANQVGNWFPNKLIHPNELKDVSKKVHENGMKFMLWFEPERADVTSVAYNKHRNWFLTRKDDPYNRLLNLGNKEARDYIINLLSGYIENLNIDLYRQDFNTDSSFYWEENDAFDRKGITQLKYVNGFYIFWDSLLERFPDLIIDNCASGGKRLDLETISRSVPFWRSDYQCIYDRDAEALQSHNTGISNFLPFSASGVGQIMDDKYRCRSCYSASFGTNFLGYEFSNANTITPNLIDILDEFKQVREYFSWDYYPLFGYSTSHNCWAGYQFNRPENNDGIVLVFRRDECPNPTAEIKLTGICEDAEYLLYDFDSKTTSTYTGKQLSEGIILEIKDKRDSRLIKYTIKK